MIDFLQLKMLLGAVAGCVYGGIGYAIAKLQGEKFEPKRFGKTVLVGFILGLIGTSAGVDISTAENYTLLQLTTAFADWVTNKFETKP